MSEINRGLYMNEVIGEKSETFGQTLEQIQEVLKKIGKFEKLKTNRREGKTKTKERQIDFNINRSRTTCPFKSQIYPFPCDHFVTMILEKSRKKTIKDHNRDFVENSEMPDNRGS